MMHQNQTDPNSHTDLIPKPLLTTGRKKNPTNFMGYGEVKKTPNTKKPE